MLLANQGKYKKLWVSCLINLSSKLQGVEFLNFHSILNTVKDHLQKKFNVKSGRMTLTQMSFIPGAHR